MKTSIIPISLLMCLIMACNRKEVSDDSATHRLEINLEQDETWWVGVISQAHLFPLTAASEYQFDFFGNTAGNQGQPLLLSNKGRYIWNEEPFSFSFENGKITCECGLAGFQSSQAGTSLKEAYLFCSKTFCPPSGKIPAEELFTLPQFNTWIEFTYDQNQEGNNNYVLNTFGVK